MTRQERRQQREYEIREELEFWKGVRSHDGYELEPESEYERELREELIDVRNQDEFGVPRY